MGRWRWGGAAALCAFLLGCGPAQDGAQGAGPAAAAGAADRPRVVSLSPLATRFVLALDAGPQLVGVDGESGRLPGLEAVARVDLADAHGLGPDLVLVPTPPAADDPGAAALAAAGAGLVEFAPHDLEDVLDLARGLGARLVGGLRASRFEVEISRPLAEIGGASFGRTRPRVLGIVALDPLVVAGGHSFETDLIEIAGGRSVTHGGAEPTLAPGPRPWEAFAPDLVLVMTPQAPAAVALAAAFAALPAEVGLEHFAVEAESFWLEDDQASARRLRAVIEANARALDARR